MLEIYAVKFLGGSMQFIIFLSFRLTCTDLVCNFCIRLICIAILSLSCWTADTLPNGKESIGVRSGKFSMESGPSLLISLTLKVSLKININE